MTLVFTGAVIFSSGIDGMHFEVASLKSDVEVNELVGKYQQAEVANATP